MCHRDSLVKTASRSVLHMQTAFDQMNVHLHHLRSDRTQQLGHHRRHPGRRARPGALGGAGPPPDQSQRATLIKALEGDWRPDYRLTLRHARRTYAQYQQLISECDQEVEATSARSSRCRSRLPRTLRTSNPPVPLRCAWNRLRRLGNGATYKPTSRACSAPT